MKRPKLLARTEVHSKIDSCDGQYHKIVCESQDNYGQQIVRVLPKVPSNRLPRVHRETRKHDGQIGDEGLSFRTYLLLGASSEIH